jgi:RHS repeat-associated protein
VYQYTYDALRRLTDVTINGALAEHFEYDQNGNRTLGFNAAAGTTHVGVYDDQDRLLSYGPWTFAYTANGELETKTNTATNETWLFQYDVLGNLLTVGLPNGDLVEYLVDGMGRRVAKIKNGVLLRQWIYKDSLKPVAELDGAGNLVAQFVYGAKGNVPDYVLRGGGTYRVISDHLGSPRHVVNMSNSGDVRFTASYTAFGEASGTGLDWMPFGFAGGIYDGDSGLVRFGARDYDPLAGRWTAKDPARFAGDGPNLYGYALEDPVNGIDQSGRSAIFIARAITACLLFALEEGGRRYPHQNAARHCYASCVASRLCTYPIAIGAGLLLEAVGGFSGDWREDVAANAEGAAIGAIPYYAGDNDCESRCEEYERCSR